MKLMIILKKKQREVISIHIGQAGVQMGNAAWELYCLEHGKMFTNICSKMIIVLVIVLGLYCKVPAFIALSDAISEIAAIRHQLVKSASRLYTQSMISNL